MKGDERAVEQVDCLKNVYERALGWIEQSELSPAEKQDAVLAVTEAMQDPAVQRYIQMEAAAQASLKGKDLEAATDAEVQEMRVRMERLVVLEKEGVVFYEAYEVGPDGFRYESRGARRPVEGQGIVIESGSGIKEGLDLSQQPPNREEMLETLLGAADNELAVIQERSLTDEFKVLWFENRGTISQVAERIKFVGELKSAIEVFSGYDYIAQEPVSRAAAAVSLLVGLVSPTGSSAKGGVILAIKHVGKKVTHKGAKKVIKGIEDLLEGKKERKVNSAHKADSEFWKQQRPYRGKIKTNGKQGKVKEYYDWDGQHKDIEAYDHKGDHLGSLDPQTGKKCKEKVPGRNIRHKL